MALEEPWIPLAALLIGAALVVLGVRVRLGLHRGIRWQYFNPDLPAYQRNGALALIPGGLSFLLAGGAILAAAGAGGNGGEALALRVGLTLAMGLLAAIAAAVAFRVWFRPPEWTKPDWLKEEERARREGRPVPDVPAVAMTPAQYRLGWALWGAALIAWGALDRSGGLLIGLGMAGNILYAVRPRGAPPQPGDAP